MTRRKFTATYRTRKNADGDKVWDYDIADARGNIICGGADHPSKKSAETAADADIQRLRQETT